MAENGPKTRVLVVDDDQTLCEMYAERLRAQGFDVKVAYNGEDGLARAVDYLPHVILLDLMMPKVNGFDTLEILKSTPETKNIPVIILTALIQQENKKRGLAAGAADYIVKSETMPGGVVSKILKVIEGSKKNEVKVADSRGNGSQDAPEAKEKTEEPEEK